MLVRKQRTYTILEGDDDGNDVGGSIGNTNVSANLDSQKMDTRKKCFRKKTEYQDDEDDELQLGKKKDMLKDGQLRLVYSRDIMELQLKQRDCEVLIRKKEALPQPPVTAPYVMMQSHSPQAMVPSQLPQAHAAPASAGLVASPTVSAAPPTTEKPKSSHPPLKCPMTGALYRCPAPGAQPFVKVGNILGRYSDLMEGFNKFIDRAEKSGKC